MARFWSDQELAGRTDEEGNAPRLLILVPEVKVIVQSSLGYHTLRYHQPGKNLISAPMDRPMLKYNK